MTATADAPFRAELQKASDTELEVIAAVLAMCRRHHSGVVEIRMRVGAKPLIQHYKIDDKIEGERLPDPRDVWAGSPPVKWSR